MVIWFSGHLGLVRAYSLLSPVEMSEVASMVEERGLPRLRVAASRLQAWLLEVFPSRQLLSIVCMFL